MAAPPGDEPIPGVDRVYCPWRYDGVARDLVLALKLRHQRPAAEPLADALAMLVQGGGGRAAVVTWVPARRADRRRRGFDHAELIARHVAADLGLPVAGLLERASVRPDQAGLGRRQRWENLAGAFTGRPFSGVVLLVDDLVTTGATAAACARALRVGGATQVELAAPCRA
jgi:predicted amidophosphoribosyltransferase